MGEFGLYCEVGERGIPICTMEDDVKEITFAVPCYNSAAYMKKCIESLLLGGDRVEIIIVNDGSKDTTGEIADIYAEKYPGFVKAIHQEN